ncbi:MAG: hypothetical protein MK135_17500, partial [Polyangiaceae bacterium]|nr:hypothetical protein [Polyangiaceae bacterium]
NAGWPILRTYGMTETAAQVATEIVPGAGMVPLKGVELRLNSKGEVEVRSPQLLNFYLGKNAAGAWEAKDPRAKDGFFNTHDLGEITPGPPPHLAILGRSDARFITGGENVSPEWVENTLRTEEIFYLTARQDKTWGDALVGIIVEAEAPGADISRLDPTAESKLRALAKEQLPPYAQPKTWLRCRRLPRTALGKVRRKELRRLVEEHYEHREGDPS